ncbi:MAG: AAA family ATPase [Eubacterium sp.]|nr:AAA family ATPase [Eubacterium sp.]
MNIKEAKQEIKNTVKAYLKKDKNNTYVIPEIRQRPILMMGPPGVGKTQIISQIVEECQIGLVSYTITHHTRQTAVGLPFIQEKTYDGKKYSITEYTMSEIIASIHDEMERSGKREGILFIDEINCVSETLAPTMLQFLQCKTFGNQKIPAGWIIVSAGNPPEYNRSVREFDVVTLDRVRQIDVEADYDVWREYAADADIHRAIRAYLDIHPENFYRMETDTDGRHFVTARGWEDLSNLISVYRDEKIPVTEAVIYEYLYHKEVAEDFATYLELFFKYEEDYPIDRILSSDVPSVIYERLLKAGFDERVTVVELVTKALLNKIGVYLSAAESGASEADALKTDAAAAVSAAFSFMEDAFGEGQEMILFVTELTITMESAIFLAEVPNEKYIHYSEELMMGTKRGKLLAELDR